MAIRATQAAPAGHPSINPLGDAKEPLQVRIPVPIKRRFKAHAAMRGLEPNELFVEVWTHYERTVVGANSESSAQ